jgi:hypothetical protein
MSHLLSNTPFSIVDYEAESLAPRGTHTFARIHLKGRPGPPAVFTIIGRIKGAPRLGNYGTYGDVSYNRKNKVKENAKVIKEY